MCGHDGPHHFFLSGDARDALHLFPFRQHEHGIGFQPVIFIRDADRLEAYPTDVITVRLFILPSRPPACV